MFDIKKFLTENRIPLHEKSEALNNLLQLQRAMEQFGMKSDLAAYKIDPSYPRYDGSVAREVEQQTKIILTAIRKLKRLLKR